MPIDEEVGRAAEGREVPHPAGKSEEEEEAAAAAVGRTDPLSVDRLPPSQPMSLIGRPIFPPRSQGDVRYGLRRLDVEGQRRYSFDLRGKELGLDGSNSQTLRDLHNGGLGLPWRKRAHIFRLTTKHIRESGLRKSQDKIAKDRMMSTYIKLGCK